MRRTLNRNEVISIKTREHWGPAFRARSYGGGLLEVTTVDGWDGFRVAPDLMTKIEPQFDPWRDGDGYAWFETDEETSVVPMILPEFFVKDEVDISRENFCLKRAEILEAIHISKTEYESVRE